MGVQPTHRDWRVSAGQLWWSINAEGFAGQDGTDIRLSLNVLGESVTVGVVLIVFL